MSFASLNLSDPILKAVTNCGYLKPTPIQAQAIPIARAGHDIIAKAPTGTGKTAAFILPALERILLAKTRQKARILVLTPTRELANQITDVIYQYGKELRVNAVSILGGMPYHVQLRKLSRPLDIIVATPGRLIDYMQRGNLDFSQIEMVVLDEADRMLDMGFSEDVLFILDATPQSRQTLLFTATTDQPLIKLARTILKSPQQIDITNNNITLENIIQRVHIADDIRHKSKLLQHLLSSENVFKAIIFSATKRNADDLARQLRDAGHKADALHGDMNQRKRNRTIDEFRHGKTQYLIATDVAARGIDINDISHVINFDIPRFAEDYVHRIGRTGRAGRNGTAVSYVLSSEGAHLKRIEKFTGQTIACSTIPGLEPKQRVYSSGSNGGGRGGRGGRSGGRGGQSEKPWQRQDRPGSYSKSRFDQGKTGKRFARKKD